MGVRVVIAEASGMMRQLFAETLAQRGLVVVGQTGTATELPGVVDVTEPDVVLADPRLPPNQRDDGLTAAEVVHYRHPHVGLLILSHDGDTAHVLRLLELTPRGGGYLVKERVRNIGRLIEAINGVAAGEVIVDPKLVRRLMVRPSGFPDAPMPIRSTATSRRPTGSLGRTLRHRCDETGCRAGTPPAVRLRPRRSAASTRAPRHRDERSDRRSPPVNP